MWADIGVNTYSNIGTSQKVRSQESSISQRSDNRRHPLF